MHTSTQTPVPVSRLRATVTIQTPKPSTSNMNTCLPHPIIGNGALPLPGQTFGVILKFSLYPTSHIHPICKRIGAILKIQPQFGCFFLFAGTHKEAILTSCLQQVTITTCLDYPNSLFVGCLCLFILCLCLCLPRIYSQNKPQ